MCSKLQILANDKIDAAQWDLCVQRAENGLIYSTYEYLNSVCDNWHGLVIDNYEAVMPLPWRKKWGIRYLYEPPFIQQLGITGNKIPEEVLSTVFSFAKYGDILFNFSNAAFAQTITPATRTNLVIDLSQGYESISSKYKKDLQQNIKKAQQEQTSVSVDNDIKIAIASYKKHYNERFRHITEKDFASLERLCLSLSQKRRCFTRTILSGSGELLATGLFLKDEKRIYNLMNTTTVLGRKKEANHYLLDSILKEFSGQSLLFDFEGSDLPGVKSFYEKFGASTQPYFQYHFNKLPFPLRLLKR
jgi:hypothetical protein